MNTPTITDPTRVDAAYTQAEHVLWEAAEAERTAFARWQQAYGAYELARDSAATARANRAAQAIVP